MSVDEQLVEDFVGEMVDKYEEESIIGNVFTRQNLVSPPRTDTTHLTNQVSLPKGPLIPGSPQFFAGANKKFAKGLCTVERLHILNDILASDDVSSVDLDSVSHKGINNLFREVYSPTDLFLPMESEYFRQAANSMKSIDEFQFPDSTIPIHWISSDDFDHGFLVDGSKITVGQVKDSDQISIPLHGPQISKYSSFTDGRYLIARFANGRGSGNYEFSYSTMFTSPSIRQKNSAVVINMP